MARDGHRYHCPALVFHDGSCYVSRAAAPEETEGDMQFLPVFYRTLAPSVPSSAAAQKGEEHGERRTK